MLFNELLAVKNPELPSHDNADVWRIINAIVLENNLEILRVSPEV